MRCVSQLAALALFAVLPALAAGQELFGSIAYSAKDNQHGWANDYTTRDAAEEAALAFCRKTSSDCKVVLWFRNACGALVTGPESHAAAWDQKQEAAVNKALKSCTARSNGCALTRTFCTSHKSK